MTPVAGRIYQDIIRFLLQTALNYCLQILVFNLKFLKRKIIHINNKLIIPVLDLRNHIIQILELMFIDFDHTKSLIIILIQDRLDRGRFSGSRIPVEQTVIGSSSFHKSFRILDQFLFLYIISYQII